MRSITFIRHAKASHHTQASDLERPLSEKGISDASMMSQIIKNEFILPDLIISSTAKRAKMTSNIFADNIGYPKQEIIFMEDLYFADSESFFKIIHSLENSFKNIYIVSHNPGITYIVNRISNIRLDVMPTCGVAQIGFEKESFNEIIDKSGKLLKFDMPKNHI
jgi:phosphohistidine phosphatase